MRVIERSVRARARGIPAEDVVVVTDDLAAVVDGVTDKSGRRWRLGGVGMTSGHLAATVVAAAIEALPPEAEPRVAVDLLTAVLAEELTTQAPDLAPEDRPAAAVAVYNAVRREAWRVGDVRVAADGSVVLGGDLRAERVAADLRAAYVAALTAGGVPPTEPALDALARQAVAPFLRMQMLLANTTGEFGFGVLNGVPVPDAHLEVVDLSGAGEVVLASDGYPRVLATLAESERYLHDALARDPLCVGEVRGVKGMAPGADSYDDRAWLRLAVHPH